MLWAEHVLILSFLNKENWTNLIPGKKRPSSPPSPPFFLREVHRGYGGMEASLKKKKK
jgi:hypothetical protein